MNVSSIFRPLRTSGILGISAQIPSSIRRQVGDVTCSRPSTRSRVRPTRYARYSTRGLCNASPWTPGPVQVRRDTRFRSFSVISCIRRLSSDTPSSIGQYVGVDMKQINRNHPSQKEDMLSQDPELRSILDEIASDFGKSHKTPREAETTQVKDSKAAKVESNIEGVVTRDLKEGFVAMTTENEDDGGSAVAMDISPAKASGDSSFVFSIDNIVEVLREENAQDICVIAVPPEKNYVDYFIVVTGRSTRHLSAMTQHINKLYKQRKSNDDPFLSVEGKFAEDWMCLDFGNIVVHFMLEETRALYNLEELWSLGKEFDSHIQQWDQHELLLFNPETDLQTPSQEQGEAHEKSEN